MVVTVGSTGWPLLTRSTVPVCRTFLFALRDCNSRGPSDAAPLFRCFGELSGPNVGVPGFLTFVLPSGPL